MSRPPFLADQDFNENILRGVHRLEPAVEFWKLRDVGLDKASDAEVLAYAASENWIVVSHDVNTMSAAANTRLRAGQPMNGLLLVH
jgi:predicted nuclease of predicted toxin-antitoxin system